MNNKGMPRVVRDMVRWANALPKPTSQVGKRGARMGGQPGRNR